MPCLWQVSFVLWSLFVSSPAEQLRKASVSRVVRLCPSVRPRGAERLAPDDVYWNSVACIFSNICEHVTVAVKIGQKQRAFCMNTTHIHDPPSWRVFVIDRGCVLCEVRCEVEETVASSDVIHCKRRGILIVNLPPYDISMIFDGVPVIRTQRNPRACVKIPRDFLESI